MLEGVPSVDSIEITPTASERSDNRNIAPYRIFSSARYPQFDCGKFQTRVNVHASHEISPQWFDLRESFDQYSNDQPSVHAQVEHGAVRSQLPSPNYEF